MKQKTGITKKDVKNAVAEVITHFAKATQKDFARIDRRFDSMDKRLDSTDARISNLEYDILEIKRDIVEMKKSLSELFVKLDWVIGLYKKQEMEFSSLAAQVKRLEARIVELEMRKA
ncbi:hypothetical protein A3I34_00060 [Candidatus Jorgensenbacteria bacterium RIFCSPLOWO2_02_FULL_45_12]|uniref:Uncharacterized protein n=2 Tax=Candidatus Joergenseniibacteriota TaxID=1752739 RepID=A0A1F6BQN9_9BACT|nr:MAG: hypothetical protein UX22_C0028G0004 [Candidatus Jorgensenbacteria bacterium GW2011_GWA2_45_9]OGG39240.1 MAG: hypothetical protein A3D55_01070 [Candidatus Jorgensenbacteria bacterium RIFCSPHIGHO2_02_FULL_45_20]OGG42532.1 MAG: hypothetical protein A3I34_00060 [Candidatus Jorgensenbacteria bacterium RIFCSPLOWO2_02_FULL_45_12]